MPAGNHGNDSPARMNPRIENAALSAIEHGLALVPRARPPADRLARAKVIAHRGEHDNRRVGENTLAAFDALRDTGVWGIELDLRWTRDLEPVVCHDPDLRRVFGQRLTIAETDYATLRARCPRLPHLGDVLARYAGRFHLMLELKAEAYPDPDAQQARLLDHLAGLGPGADYHLLALETGLFEHASDLPTACRLPVARLNTAEMSDYALGHGCAGVAGPHFALGRRLIARHAAAGQVIGVGFPSRRGVAFREIARGAEWLFSNHARRLQVEIERAAG